MQGLQPEFECASAHHLLCPILALAEPCDPAACSFQISTHRCRDSKGAPIITAKAMSSVSRRIVSLALKTTRGLALLNDSQLSRQSCRQPYSQSSNHETEVVSFIRLVELEVPAGSSVYISEAYASVCERQGQLAPVQSKELLNCGSKLWAWRRA